jgi:hypothetical protein
MNINNDNGGGKKDSLKEWTTGNNKKASHKIKVGNRFHGKLLFSYLVI